MLIVLAGPEKAGKSTVARLLQERHHAEVVHWGPIKHDSEFLGRLKKDVDTDRLVVWDRGWPCDCVYSFLLKRNRRAKGDWWVLEWLYGRALQSTGVGCIMLGPDARRLAELRDDTDLPVLPDQERFAYRAYGERFGWRVEENRHTTEASVALADDLAHRAHERRAQRDRRWMPPNYCGPVGAKVVFVGQGRNMQSNYPGSWLPFTTRLTERYGRILGSRAFECSWTNIDGPPRALEEAKLVVACGATAHAWAVGQTRPGKVLKVPHPAWLYRWGRGEADRGRWETAIKQAVQRVLVNSTEKERDGKQHQVPVGVR